MPFRVRNGGIRTRQIDGDNLLLRCTGKVQRAFHIADHSGILPGAKLMLPAAPLRRAASVGAEEPRITHSHHFAHPFGIVGWP
jgi:hypothetical protein